MKGIAGSGRAKTENCRSINIRQLARAGHLPPDSPHLCAEGVVHNVTWVGCHYGGSRPWFVCPLCQRFVATLYAGRDVWACRKCLGLAYASQCEGETGRAMRRLTKAQDKLAQHGGGRPKGMHRRTYLRLLEQQAQTEQFLLGRLT